MDDPTSLGTQGVVDLWRLERWLALGFADPTVFDDLREQDERNERTYARLRTRDILIYPPIICALGAGLVTAARADRCRPGHCSCKYVRHRRPGRAGRHRDQVHPPAQRATRSGLLSLD